MLPKVYRINKKADFSKALSSRLRYKLCGFMAFVVSSNLAKPRLGISVPKRFVKLSVSRNKTKRLIREWFQAKINAFPEKQDWVIIAKQETSKAAAYKILDKLFEKHYGNIAKV